MDDLKEIIQRLQMSPHEVSLDRKEEESRKIHEFWDTQPMHDDNADEPLHQAIEAEVTASHIRQTPYTTPAAFRWDTVDVDDPATLRDLYVLLRDNYVEDDNAMFRFDYPPEFLRWALQPPGWRKEWHCGLRVVRNNLLVAFISAVPVTVRMASVTKTLAEVNFLCVHKKLRSKRVTPMLIKEVTRRIHLQGVFQAVFTGSVVLPGRVATCRYWHRPLNPKKLIDVRFSQLRRNCTLQRTLRLFRLPARTSTPGFRTLTDADVPQAHRLLDQFLQRFQLSAAFSEEEFRHWFLPRDGIVYSYVVEDGGVVTDFASYYSLPSSVLHHPVHQALNIAYAFYTVAGSTAWCDLMKDVLVTAKSQGFDVFNALDVMHNGRFLNHMQFVMGDGALHYYIYNWRMAPSGPHQIGLVLL